MNIEAKKILKEKILDLILKTEIDISDLDRITQPISPENSLGRVSRMDAINNKSVVEASLRQSKKKLSKLKISLTKIEDKNFGKCMRCGNNIQEKRLMFLPQSDKCVRCAE